MTDNSFIIYQAPGAVEAVRSELSRDNNGVLRFGDVTLHAWDSMPAEMPVCRTSTNRNDYTRAVASAVDVLKTDGGKTVLCRQICGEFTDFSPMLMWERYRTAFPDMFRFILYTPQTGWWMGASPELLAECRDSHTAHTRALAGTRSITEHNKPWDSKNLHEHAVVVEDICARAEALGHEWKCTPGTAGTLSYRNIEHLCTPVTVNYSGLDKEFPMELLIEAIHPTAAIAGYPKQRALSEIARLETFPRNLYGGYISIPGLAYVVLRCVHFDNTGWCVYTGSGLTPDSTPDDEWNETEAKAAGLLDLLYPFSK